MTKKQHAIVDAFEGLTKGGDSRDVALSKLMALGVSHDEVKEALALDGKFIA